VRQTDLKQASLNKQKTTTTGTTKRMKGPQKKNKTKQKKLNKNIAFSLSRARKKFSRQDGNN